MRTRGLWLVLALLAGAPATAACPPAGRDKAALETLKADGFKLDDKAARESLALGLVACLGDADPVGHHIGGGGLEGGAEIGNVLRAERGGGFGLEADRRLEAGEGEVGFLAADERPGQMEAVGMAAQGLPLDGRAPGIAELQQLGRLVEGFAEGVVDGGADAAIAADAVDAQQLAVTAGDQQQQVGKVEFVG